MAMRMSSLFLRTLREDPADAEVPSRLLVRAGYIRRVAPGIYTWLPLGLKILRRVEQIVREEMDAIGAQELLFPALLPREPYEASGRWTEYGDNIFRLKDRKDADYLLGPTHEELFTLTVKDMYSSYKDLPVSLYQIQNKYRDEARPRAGILRGREFVMKDSYSFDIDEAGLQKSYDLHREAYIKIFDRLGFHYVIVAAMAGAMGGSKSEEFLATAENGEDTYVRCPNCGYAANVEAVRVPVPPAQDWTDVPAAHVEDTPETPTIATLVDHLNAHFPRRDRPWVAGDTLKNVLVTVTSPDGTQEILAIAVPGDRDVDEKRLGASSTPPSRPSSRTSSTTKLVKGYIGPGVLGAGKPAGVRFLVDPRVVDGTRWVTGADQPGRHVVDLVAGRDFTADGTIEAAEVRAVTSARAAGTSWRPRAASRWATSSSWERSTPRHSGSRSSTRRPARDRHDGLLRRRRLEAVAAIAEGNYDEQGLCWPREITPADVHLVATGKDDEVYLKAQEIVRQLEAAGLEVIYDDRRQVSPGVKFKDSELIGVPTIVVVGRGLADGTIEVKDRRSGERRVVPVDSAVAEVVAEVRGAGHPST